MTPPAPLSELYVMDENRRARPATSIKEWRHAFIKTNRTVLRNDIGPRLWVHTFFVGYNLDPVPGEPPVVFQTVVSGAKYPKAHYYATWLEAVQGHAMALALLGDLASGMRRPPILTAYDGGKSREKKPARASEWPRDYQLRSNE